MYPFFLIISLLYIEPSLNMPIFSWFEPDFILILCLFFQFQDLVIHLSAGATPRLRNPSIVA